MCVAIDDEVLLYMSKVSIAQPQCHHILKHQRRIGDEAQELKIVANDLKRTRSVISSFVAFTIISARHTVPREI